MEKIIMKKLLIVILTMMMILFFIACTPAGPFTLTLNITGTGSVTLNPIGGTYEAGKVVTLTANTNPAYTFTGWGGGFVWFYEPNNNYNGL
jgi:hypothetical protein